jgi:hypothetical protein
MPVTLKLNDGYTGYELEVQAGRLYGSKKGGIVAVYIVTTRREIQYRGQWPRRRRNKWLISKLGTTSTPRAIFV